MSLTEGAVRDELPEIGICVSIAPQRFGNGSRGKSCGDVISASAAFFVDLVRYARHDEMRRGRSIDKAEDGHSRKLGEYRPRHFSGPKARREDGDRLSDHHDKHTRFRAHQNFCWKRVVDLVVWMQVGAKARTDTRGNRHARKASSGSLTEANIVNGNGYSEERDQNGGKDCCQPPRRRICCAQPECHCTEDRGRNADSTR